MLLIMSQPADPARTIHTLPLIESPPHPCSYLLGREAKNEYLWVSQLSPSLNRSLMDLGFRRSGQVVYRPACEGCRECVPIRVPVAGFAPSRSQRRVMRRNQDVEVRIAPPDLNSEKQQIYADFLATRHDAAMTGDTEELRGFLYESPTQTLEMTYHISGRLAAVGIVDVCEDALSSVYFYFDPAESRRSLGTFGALAEIEECRRRGLKYWYIGFYVRDCAKMNYKAEFRPHELLESDGKWR
jgi:arginine-tRNA-protein transferase